MEMRIWVSPTPEECIVSGELSSMEIWAQTTRMGSREQFQENLVVWKSSRTHAIEYALSQFQENLVVWKSWGTVKIIYDLFKFQENLVVWKQFFSLLRNYHIVKFQENLVVWKCDRGRSPWGLCPCFRRTQQYGNTLIMHILIISLLRFRRTQQYGNQVSFIVMPSPCHVSGELSSMEIIVATWRTVWDREFQENLVVWKYAISSVGTGMQKMFQENLVVWKFSSSR